MEFAVKIRVRASIRAQRHEIFYCNCIFSIFACTVDTIDAHGHYCTLCSIFLL